MWNKTQAAELLKINYPIIQGPFGGRFSSVKLLSTVSNLGGLGSFGLNSYSPEEILEVGEQIKLATQKSYNLNLWVPLKNDPVFQFDKTSFKLWLEKFAPYFEAENLPLPQMPEIKPPLFDDQLEAVLQVEPHVASFIFGIPSKEVLQELRKRNTVIILAATTLEEAQLAEEAKADLIVATGQEAGGHRPSFLKPAEKSLNSTITLVKDIVQKVRTPVIAAGGISDAHKAWEYLQAGASAVQLGTAFLATEESGANDIHKHNLRSPNSFTTKLSRVFTGRLARTIASEFPPTEPHNIEPYIAPYPVQSKLLSPLMKRYSEKQETQKQAFWAGEPSSILKEHTAEGLFNSLILEINQLDSK